MIKNIINIFLQFPNKAKAIYNIDEFINNIKSNNDEILDFCKGAPSFEVALDKFGK